jgi:hypothetical protein
MKIPVLQFLHLKLNVGLWLLEIYREYCRYSNILANCTLAILGVCVFGSSYIELTLGSVSKAKLCLDEQIGSQDEPRESVHVISDEPRESVHVISENSS